VSLWPVSFQRYNIVLLDAAAEERDPENFNPSSHLRGRFIYSVKTSYLILIYSTLDYDAIDLPVFTCSSRDYVRLQGGL
jgi:hypothetical protein